MFHFSAEPENALSSQHRFEVFAKKCVNGLYGSPELLHRRNIAIFEAVQLTYELKKMTKCP